MKLIIDAGNTTVKIAVFQGSKLVCKQVLGEGQLKLALEKITKKYSAIRFAILSSVSAVNKITISEVLSNNVDVLSLDYKTKIPFINKYTTPNTLGVDRIALVASAVCEFPKKNCLIIDAGSCITYDFVNSNKEYYGGAIGPGLQIRYKSLNSYTANLPLLIPSQVDSFIGDSTEKAIHVGVNLGMQMEIKAVIEDFSNNYPELVVILTGGDADFLSKRFKNGIFVLPNFLLEGLNHILDYNNNT